MGETRDDGGPAFPVTGSSESQLFPRELGMVLRDYFAGQAVASMYTLSIYDVDNAAEKAYQIADAMLKARRVT